MIAWPFKLMKLNYSFNDVTPILLPGTPPLQTNSVHKIRVHIKRESDGQFPAFFEEADLLPYGRNDGSLYGYTLLLTYIAGRTPPSNQPPRIGGWTPVPNSPIYGQIRIPLPGDTVKLIKHEKGHKIPLCIHIPEAELYDVTKRND